MTAEMAFVNVREWTARCLAAAASTVRSRGRSSTGCGSGRRQVESCCVLLAFRLMLARARIFTASVRFASAWVRVSAKMRRARTRSVEGSVAAGNACRLGCARRRGRVAKVVPGVWQSGRDTRHTQAMLSLAGGQLQRTQMKAGAVPRRWRVGLGKTF